MHAGFDDKSVRAQTLFFTAFSDQCYGGVADRAPVGTCGAGEVWCWNCVMVEVCRLLASRTARLWGRVDRVDVWWWRRKVMLSASDREVTKKAVCPSIYLAACPFVCQF